MERKYTLKELQQLETITQGHTDNLKIETEDIKVYLSRMTVEDGMTANNMVTVKKLTDGGNWEIIAEYPAAILYHSGVDQRTAKEILRKIKSQIGYREKEILENLAEVENNLEVPEGYLQYIFYDAGGEGFQAGKDVYGKWGITN